MAGPFKMKAGKEGPMKKNFGISPVKQDKMKASQTKTNKKTGKTTTNDNPGSKNNKKKVIEMPTPNTLEQGIKNAGRGVEMPFPNTFDLKKPDRKVVEMPSPSLSMEFMQKLKGSKK